MGKQWEPLSRGMLYYDFRINKITLAAVLREDGREIRAKVGQSKRNHGVSNHGGAVGL